MILIPIMIIQDFIIHKDLVELVQLLLGTEEDFDNLVNGEEGDAKTKDDVGIEGDELVNSLLSFSIFSIVGAVPCHPPGLETRVCVRICMVCSTEVFLRIFDIRYKTGSLLDYLAICAEYGCAQDDGMRNEDDPHQEKAVHAEILELLPPGPHNPLGLAVTKNLRRPDLYRAVFSTLKIGGWISTYVPSPSEFCSVTLFCSPPPPVT